MNRYERYKDSGVPWLGEIPEHWNICRLKDEVTFNDEVLGDKTDADYEILYVDISSVSLIEGIVQKEPMSFENSPSRARRIVKNGDVIVSTVRTYLKAITQIQDAEDNLIVSTGFAVLRPKKNLFPRFLGYWVQSENMIGAIVSNSVGVSYPAINATDLVRLPIVKLPLKEQTAIAHYLDTKPGEIDALIDKQQTLLEKLAEQRTAVITHAVTKGLNPAAPMKKSGVEWLGDVPAHWDIVGISNLFMLKAGGDLQPDLFSREKDDEHCYPIYTNANDEHAVYGYTSQKRFNADSITVSGRGDIGFAVYRDHDFDAIIRLLVLSPLKKLDCKYYTYSINALLDFKFESSAVAQLSTVQLAQYKLLLPSYEEQTTIADYLDQETAKIDRLCETVNQTIGRLKEYRMALITQAVTGKIKVTDE